MIRAEMESAREAPAVTHGCGEPAVLSAFCRVGVARFALLSDQSWRKGEE
ncbi:hypothetical protein azo3717 [Azoarcus olearius]|uniref:Uncharacterized protein n=1 Tax=Azoarcus sp. (strain BH72) TaxID=418699 RepID=A1KBX7_AZOSB|nr:hypothetical protein azo3717 [Azoarcus olearius]